MRSHLLIYISLAQMKGLMKDNIELDLKSYCLSVQFNAQSPSNIMLKTQRQRCRQPVMAQMMSPRQSISRPRNRQLIEELSPRKDKVAQSNSDNNHNRQTIADKKLKSLNLIPKQEVRIQLDFDEYQMGNRNSFKSKALKEVSTQHRYNQCLRDDTSSSNYGQIVSHYRQSKSRYKNGKEKAKKLIENMLTSSKDNNQQLKNQLIRKIDQVKCQLPIEKSPSQQYCINERVLQKCSSTSGSSGFRPKVQKCSTLRRADRQSSPLVGRQYSGALSSRGSMYSEQQGVQSPIKTQSKQQTILKNSKIRLSKQKQTTVITNSEPSYVSSNLLVRKQQHLFTQYGINEYGKPSTQKSIKQETQHMSKQVSRQMPITKRQTQKLITRARQKNKKIIGKLKQMREKRSAFRNSQHNKIEMSQNSSRVSKIAVGSFKSSLKTSNLRSKLDQSRQKFMQSSGNNFLNVESRVHSSSVIAFNDQIRQKILIHVQTIKVIADYAQTFNEIYQDCNQWQDLIFLLYKKYYIERFKIHSILKTGFAKFKDGSTTKQSPFSFDFCSVLDAQIQVFRESKQQVSLQLEFQNANYSIKTSLRDLYNKFIEKTSENPCINMYEVDNFSEQILEDLNEQINMLIQSCGKSAKIKKRINKAIKIGLMIAHLEGYVLEEIQEIVFGQVEGREYFDKFYPQFMGIFETDQKNQ